MRDRSISKRRPNPHLTPKPQPTHRACIQFWAGWVEGPGRPPSGKRKRPPITRHGFTSETEAYAYAAQLRAQHPDRTAVLIWVEQVGHPWRKPQPELSTPPWPPRARRLTP